MVDIELLKFYDPEIFEKGKNVNVDKRGIERLPLNEIKKVNPQMEKELRDGAFAKAKVQGGYACAHCGKIFPNRQFLHVDHIKPMNNGGLSTLDNLQILCRSCNAKKGDKSEGEC